MLLNIDVIVKHPSVLKVKRSILHQWCDLLPGSTARPVETLTQCARPTAHGRPTPPVRATGGS